MNGFDRLVTVLAIGTLALAQTGCATQGSYDSLADERDQLRRDLDALTIEMEAAQGQLTSRAASSNEQAARSAALIRELEAEVAAGQVRIRQAMDGVSIDVADELLFDSGSTDLSGSGRALLRRVAAELKALDTDVSVEGHTDSWMIREDRREQYPSNWELGASRAAKVVRRLSAEGVDPSRLRVVSRGPFDPIASNDTPEGRRSNRRIAIVVRDVAR